MFILFSDFSKAGSTWHGYVHCFFIHDDANSLCQVKWILDFKMLESGNNFLVFEISHGWISTIFHYDMECLNNNKIRQNWHGTENKNVNFFDKFTDISMCWSLETWNECYDWLSLKIKYTKYQQNHSDDGHLDYRKASG